MCHELLYYTYTPLVSQLCKTCGDRNASRNETTDESVSFKERVVFRLFAFSCAMKSAIRQAKNVAMGNDQLSKGYSDTQIKVRQATSNGISR